jgi:hypothetical protein
MKREWTGKTMKRKNLPVLGIVDLIFCMPVVISTVEISNIEHGLSA